MKMIVRISIYLFMLLVAGELIVSLDKQYAPLEGEQQVRMKIDIRHTEEYQLLVSGELPIRNNDVRVMILGDSYVYGGGIDYAQCVSTRLKQLLSSGMRNGQHAYVLDLSRPSNNTLDNYNTLVRFIDMYKPTHVIWAYNMNDILGPLSLLKGTTRTNDSIVTSDSIYIPKLTTKSKTTARAFIDGMYRMLPSIEYFSSKIQTLVRGHGIYLPVGDFHYLVSSAYEQKSIPWRNTKELLYSAASLAESRNAMMFSIYILPEFNLLSQPDLFTSIHSAFVDLGRYNRDLTIIYGHDDFMPEAADDLMLSKYDGHPSGRAHAVMATRWFDLILSTPASQYMEQPLSIN